MFHTICHFQYKSACPSSARLAWACLLLFVVISNQVCGQERSEGNYLRVARAGQECTDFYELPPCESEFPAPSSEAKPWQLPEGTDGTAKPRPQGEQPDYQMPSDLDLDALATDRAPSTSSTLPSGLGAVAAASSPDVNMIGDFFGSGYYLGGSDGFATVPSAGGDRRFKATDNLSPLPQDRVFFNYHHFHNAVMDINGIEQNVDRFTFGLERTCLDDTVSFEVRVPFANGLSSSQYFGLDDTMTSEIGNIAFTVKAFLWQWRSLRFAAGLATVIPTADNASVEGDGTYTEFRNEAVHLQPYFGVNYSRPCSRWFSTAYIGVDADVNGNEIRSGFDSSSLVSLGTIEDPALLYCDYQIGYWWYKDYGHIGYLNGIAPVLELHYSQMLSDPENIDGAYQNPFGQSSLLNMTMGFVFDFRRNNQVTIYGAAPLRHEEAVLFGRTVSPVFTGEFGMQWVNRY
jgi:hypothetical protein